MHWVLLRRHRAPRIKAKTMRLPSCFFHYWVGKKVTFHPNSSSKWACSFHTVMKSEVRCADIRHSHLECFITLLSFDLPRFSLLVTPITSSYHYISSGRKRDLGRWRYTVPSRWKGMLGSSVILYIFVSWTMIPKMWVVKNTWNSMRCISAVHYLTIWK